MADLGADQRVELEAFRRRVDRNVHGHIWQALRLHHLNGVATFVAALGGVVTLVLSAALLGGFTSSKIVEAWLVVASGAVTIVAVAKQFGGLANALSGIKLGAGSISSLRMAAGCFYLAKVKNHCVNSTLR